VTASARGFTLIPLEEYGRWDNLGSSQRWASHFLSRWHLRLHPFSAFSKAVIEFLTEVKPLL